MEETRENTSVFAGFMVYFSHGKDKRTPRKERGNGDHFQSGNAALDCEALQAKLHAQNQELVKKNQELEG